MKSKLTFVITEDPEGNISAQLIDGGEKEANELYDNCHKTEDNKKSRMTLITLDYENEVPATNHSVSVKAISKILMGFAPRSIGEPL